MAGATSVLLLALACSPDAQKSAPQPDQPAPLSSSPDVREDACDLAAIRGERASETEGELVVTIPDAPRCQLRFHPVVAFEWDNAGLLPVPGPHITIRSDGVIVTSSAGEGALAVWDPDGRFVRRLGRTGSAPGEFQPMAQPMIGRDDSLFVADNARSLTVFDAAFRLVRRTASANVLLTRGQWFRDDANHWVVSPAANGASAGHVMRTSALDAPGTILVPRPPSFAGRDADRLLAYGGGSTFWVGPTFTPTRRYELEQWSLDGRLLRRIRRAPSWYPPSTVSEYTGGSGAARLPTDVIGLHVDADGLLYVLIREDAPRAGPAVPGSRPSLAERFDARLEILDPVAGELLASERLDDLDEVPWPMIERTRLGRRLVAPDSDTAHVALIEWRLVARTP